MRKTILTIIALLVCMAGVFGQKKVAIMPVLDKTKSFADAEGYGKMLVLRTSLHAAISSVDGYMPLDRVDFSLAMDEAAFQRRGYVADAEIKKLGEAYGAEYVLVTEVAKYSANSMILTAKITNVESNASKSAEPKIVSYEPDKMLQSCKELARDLLRVVAGTLPPSNGGRPTSSSSGRRNGDSYNPDGIELVWVEGTGSGIMAVQGFYIGKYEVTQAQWKAVMGNNPSNWKGDLLPVESVSWEDCQEFVRKLNAMTGKKYALPTEAQWEYAANGGSARNTYEYAGSNSVGEVAWYYENSGKCTHTVGGRFPNAVGAYDMSGNVWEWCQDCYDSSCSYRVLRGGSWSYDASRCRVAYRNAYSPGSRYNDSGFRVVLLP